MKKILILCNLLLGYTYTTTHAKAKAVTNDIKFGVFGGPTIAGVNNIKVTESSKKQSRFGFHVQAFGTYQLNEYLDLALTIGYHTKGNRITNSIGNMREEDRYNCDYLQTTTQLNIFPGQDRQFFFVAGGYAGYLLAAKTHIDIYINDQKQGDTKTVDLKEETTDNKLNKWDFGVVLGWGYEFEMGLILKAVSEIGIRKIHDIDEGPGRNFAGNISLGYNFAKLLK